jgi:nicotine blue oxidoreductase
MSRDVAGLVLAAGEGRRFGRPKAVVELDGERLVDRAVRLLTDGGADPVFVVSGAVTLDVAGVFVVPNPSWRTGVGSSLLAGLDALPASVTAVVITLVDTPWLGPDSVRRLIAACTAGADLAVATYDSKPGHPVLLGRSHWDGLRAGASGDTGARAYLRGRPDVIEVDCTGTGDPSDIDTPNDLRR